MEAAADHSSLMGRVLEQRYRIVAELGEGGMGVVYRAEHLKLGRPVALKVLLAEYGKNPNLRGRFEREARALATLHHPNVVTVTDYGVADGDIPYLVMELLEGRTLRDLMSEGPMDPGPVREVTRQILRGLSYAHGQGVAHRDLKPANVFLQQLPDGHEHVKILDFGLAKFVTGDRPDSTRGAALTRTGAVLGTPAYMAPEQASGESSDARSDTYAMGILIFEMLAGQRPFDGEPGEILRQHLLSPLPRLEDLSPYVVETPELRAFLERATGKDRGSRFQNAGEMLAAFDALPDPLTREGASAIVSRPSQNPTAAGIARHGSVPASEPAGGGPDPRHVNALGTAATLPGDAGRGSQPAAPVVSAARAPRSSLPLVITALVGLVVLGGIVGGVLLVATLGGSEEGAAPEGGASAVGESAGPGAAEPAPTGAGASGGEAEEGLPRGLEPGEPDSADTREGSAAAPAAPQIDPWTQRPTPALLAAAKRQTDRRRRLSNRAMDRLRNYRRAHSDDIRAHLLLARGYLARGWRPDAMEWYENAFEAAPRAAGDPRMLEDLVLLAAHSNTTTRAQSLLRRAYGDRAAQAMDEALASGELSSEDAARLRRVRDGW